MRLQDLIDLETDVLLRFMREEGIKHLSVGNLSITLAENAGEVKAQALEPSRFDDEQEKLPCGHFLYEANELNECLHGCQGKPKEDK
jgi:hypothetical protein